LGSMREILSSGYLSNGEYARKLEAEWAGRLGRQCIAVCNGTSALEMAFRLGRVSGKRVVVPASTIYLDAYAAERAGGEVIFSDADPKNGCMRAEDLAGIDGSKVGAVCATHLGGIVTPEIMRIREICDEKGWFLLEDAAHAHGSTHPGGQAGSFGHASIFSFFNTKVATCGEGGMVALENPDGMQEAQMIADQGLLKGKNQIPGGNMRMSELSACVGLEQTRMLDEMVGKRNAIAAAYVKGLEGKIEIARPAEGSTCNYYKYSVIVPAGVDRDSLRKSISEKYGIPMPGGVYYLPCHLQPVWKGKYGKGDFPGAEEWADRHLCLPLVPQMSTEQAEYVAKILLKEVGLE